MEKPDKETELKVCLVHDESTGHKRQLAGIVKGLSSKAETVPTWLDYRETKTVGGLKWRHFDICIAAGHKTHRPMIKLAKQQKAMRCVLMKPTLPSSFFDAIICPRHDQMKSSARVLNTLGPVNDISPRPANIIPSYNLVLLGGPSKHFHWDERRLIDQVQTLAKHFPDLEWKAVTSRRTPKSTTQAFYNAFGDDFLLAHESRIDDVLHHAHQVWITPDSSNMVFESLSVGHHPGILDLNPKSHWFGRQRLKNELHYLAEEVRVSTFLDYPFIETRMVNNDSTPLNEAERAAQWLLDRYANLKKSD